MGKRGRKTEAKTDKSSIPEAPEYLRAEEKKWYDHFADCCRRSSYAVGIDSDTIALAAMRKAKLDGLREQWFSLDKSKHWILSENGSVKAHPLFAELRHAERALDLSMTQLFLTPKSRSASRIGGVREVSQAVETKNPEKLKVLKLMGG